MEPLADLGTSTSPRRAAGRALLAVTAGVLLAWSLHNVLLQRWEALHVPAAVREPALVLLRALVWLVPAILYLARFDPRPRGIALGITPLADRRGLARGVTVAAVYLVLVAALSYATAPHQGDAGRFGAWMFSLPALWMVLVSVLEELLWRGFLLGQLVRFLGARQAQLLVAGLFAAMHLPGWVTAGGLQAGFIPMVVMLFVLGLVLGAVTRASGSIYLAVLVHVAHNANAQWFAPD
jgi:membrane protease YdiL (CAAX protease family)